tara:strand:- start:143 stop:1276 length:1134 start_codon:yes stop_codon:yes gene_type:complete
MRSISIDPKNVQPGDYFIPIVEENVNIASQINQAVQHGATVLNVDLVPYARKYRKKLSSSVVVIVGSLGKSTIKELLFSILSQSLNIVKTSDHFVLDIDIPLTLMKADANTDIILIELNCHDKGSLSKWIRYVRPTHIIISEGSRYFLNNHSLTDFLSLYSQLFKAPLKWETALRHVYINYNAAFYARLYQYALQQKYLLYPYSGSNKLDENLNVCYVVARHFNISDAQIRKGVKHYSPTFHRLVSINVGPYCIIDDTYNDMCDSLVYALHYLKRYSCRKLLLLERLSGLDYTSNEDCSWLINEIIDASISIIFTLDPKIKLLAVQEVPIYYFSSLEKLYSLLISELKLNDTLLIKGTDVIQIDSCVDVIKSYVDTP